jgi:xanthine dehydrogenase accessory factor
MIALIRGGGDLGSGIALRLHRAGIKIIITEIELPLVLRRTVAFANAIYEKEMIVEGVRSKFINGLDNIDSMLQAGIIPVLIDPEFNVLKDISADVLIDARMLKSFNDYDLGKKPLIIGIGPGFIASQNCHAIIESNRGHFLGRVLWEGSAQENTGTPGKIGSVDFERIIRAPQEGLINSGILIGTIVKKGDLLGYIGSERIIAGIDGCLRGLMHDGIYVNKNEKIGDLDPRHDPSLINFISEKSLAIAGGVIEAIATYYRLIP